MSLTITQTLITILAVTAGTQLTRWFPFLLFPENKKLPKIVTYLGKVLPPAMMGFLVVYCLKNVSLDSVSNWLPEMIAILCITVLHKWKHNILLSIAGGTLVYMLLIQLVFPG